MVDTVEILLQESKKIVGELHSPHRPGGRVPNPFENSALTGLNGGHVIDGSDSGRMSKNGSIMPTFTFNAFGTYDVTGTLFGKGVRPTDFSFTFVVSNTLGGPCNVRQ
jgi:hypothetical protein